MADLLKKNKMFVGLLVYQVFSSLGGGIFSLFMLLSVHLLYENPIYTGIAAFLMAVPRLFSFAVGPFIDRSNKVRVMRITTFIEFTVVGTLVVLAYFDVLNVWFMFALILLYSITEVFERPSGGAFLRKIVHEDEILKANSLINTAAMAGGLCVAAILLGVLGIDGEDNIVIIYAISALFLLIAMIVTFFLKDKIHETKAMVHESKLKQYITELKSGGSFVRNTNFIFYFLITGVVVVFFMNIAATNMPEFATYHVGPQGYIILTFAGLAAGLFASILAGLIGEKFRVGLLVCIVMIVSGVIRVFYAYVLPLSLIGGLVLVFVYAIIRNYSVMIESSLIQRSTPKDMIARVNTVHSTCYAIFGALGALAGGVVGSIVATVDHVFVLQGIVYIAIGFVMILIPSIRRLPRINEMKGADDEETET